MSAKRLLLRWAWIAAWREVLRTPRIPAETKVGVMFLLGLAAAPFVVLVGGAAFIWWLLTGRRLAGPIGRWIGPPSRMLLNASPKQLRQLPPDIPRRHVAASREDREVLSVAAACRSTREPRRGRRGFERSFALARERISRRRGSCRSAPAGRQTRHSSSSLRRRRRPCPSCVYGPASCSSAICCCAMPQASLNAPARFSHV